MATQLETQTETSTETSLGIHTPTSTDAGQPQQEMAEPKQKEKKQFADLSKEIKELIIERVRPSSQPGGRESHVSGRLMFHR